MHIIHRCNVLTALFLSVTIYLQVCQAIRFNLQPDSKKCLKNEMYANQLAVGEYDIADLPDSVVDVQITDSNGHVAFNRDNINKHGKFAFSSDVADFYDICFKYVASAAPSSQPQPREISFDMRIGSEAKEYDTDEQDKFSELDRQLNRIEDLTNSIIVDYAYLKKREAEMRDTNESTNRRLFYQTVTSVIILLALTVWQVLYLRSFFRARKLID